MAALDEIGRPVLATDLAFRARLFTLCVAEQLEALVRGQKVIVYSPVMGTWRPMFYAPNN